MKKGVFVLFLILVVAVAACGQKETVTPVSTFTPTVTLQPTPTVEEESNHAPLDILGVWEYLDGRQSFFDINGWHSDVIEITPHYILGAESVAMPYVWEGNRIVVEANAVFLGSARVMFAVERNGEKLRISKALDPKDYILLVPKGTTPEALPTPTDTGVRQGEGPTPTPYVACEGKMKTQLYVGGYAYVADNVPNRVREEAGKSFKVIGYAQPHEAMQILEGPKCADGWTWYKVQILSSGLKGWTAEGDGKSQYWLLPCPVGTECGQPGNGGTP